MKDKKEKIKKTKKHRYKIKKALLKDSFKEIKTSYRRFISILLMALLGVGFFSGLRAASPDMLDSIDTYYKNQNVYDIEVISTLGLTNEDKEALKQIENVEEIYGTYSKDGLIKLEDKEIVSKILCVDEINTPILKEGNMPQNINECVVEANFLKNNNKKIGDYIEIEPEESEIKSNENTEYLKERNLKIVGTVESPIYISRERGTSKLGAGSINYYIYVNKDNINSEAYTEIYLKVKNSNKYQTSSNKYEEIVDETKTNIEEIKEEREQARYNELIDEANKKIQEAENEFNTEKQNGEQQLSDAEAKVQEGKNEIASGEAEIEKNESKANKEFSNAEKQINNAKAQITANELQLNNKKQEAETSFKEAETQKANLQNNLTTITAGLNEINTNYAQIEEKLKDPELTEQEKLILEKAKEQLEVKKQELETNKTTIENGIAQIETQVNTAKQEISNAEAQIASAKQEITTQEANLKTQKTKAYREINSAKQKLESSKKDIEEAEAELQKARDEFNSKISEAEGKLIDAREEVSKIENPEWYILDRNQNSGYSSFIQDADSIANLSMVFPIVFFAIATLVSLTSMTRMVEEERQEIGTLKALGYNKFQISLKYIIYSSLACIIGGVIGMNIGFQLLPRIIWDMYSMMYELPEFIISFNHQYSSLGLGLIYICIVGATIYSILREVKEEPAILLRPKAPKLGKRVLLERITPIWKRLNFSQKVTIRNIFRYKKRFLMTIIGICGCTALILAGFGIKDSISAILPSQYEDIFTYDMQITLKTSLDENQKQNFITNLQNNDKISEISEAYMLAGTTEKNNKQEDIQIIVPKDNSELEKVINLKDLETEEKITLGNDGIVITDKLAELIGANIGDTIKITDSNDIEKEVKVVNIAENYISHYVYMSREFYESIYQETYSTNVLLIKDNNLNKDQEQELSRELVAQNEVSTITLTSTIMGVLDDTMKSLDYVAVVLIVSAGLLAFVVLYNLSNVNISERIRELATIKVLGFYDKEVYTYISRETVLLTIMGILLGLAGGYFLNLYILGTCEIDMLRFVRIINPLSYLYAVLITIAFSIIVSIATYFALKKIDMIASLKSVE